MAQTATDTRVRYSGLLLEQTSYVDLVAESEGFGARRGNPDAWSRTIPHGRCCSLEECAVELGVTKQRVQQIEQNALRKLKRMPIVVFYLRELARELDSHRQPSMYEE